MGLHYDFSIEARCIQHIEDAGMHSEEMILQLGGGVAYGEGVLHQRGFAAECRVFQNALRDDGVIAAGARELPCLELAFGDGVDSRGELQAAQGTEEEREELHIDAACVLDLALKGKLSELVNDFREGFRRLLQLPNLLAQPVAAALELAQELGGMILGAVFGKATLREDARNLVEVEPPVFELEDEFHIGVVVRTEIVLTAHKGWNEKPGFKVKADRTGADVVL